MGFFSAAFGRIWLAQSQMRQSRRTGIDASEQTEMIRHGLFRHSRNPIFLGILLSFVGFFLMIPNALTLMLGGISHVSIQTQLRLEETYLHQTHGDAYEAYTQVVPPWL
ncbi:MAG: methyltransferase [Bacteroidota bacterium]